MSDLYKMPQARNQQRCEQQNQRLRDVLRLTEKDLETIVTWLDRDLDGPAAVAAKQALQRLRREKR